MNILVYRNGFEGQNAELKELLDGNEANLFVTDTIEDSISILTNNSIDFAFLEVKELTDAGILRYINEYYHKTRVFIHTDKVFEDFIRVFSHGKFKFIKSQLSINTIRNSLKINKSKEHSATI